MPAFLLYSEANQRIPGQQMAKVSNYASEAEVIVRVHKYILRLTGSRIYSMAVSSTASLFED